MHASHPVPPRGLVALVCLALGLAASSLPSTGHAASFILQVPPFPPKTYEYSHCTSYTWSGNTLTCVTSVQTPPPPPPPAPSGGTPFEGCPDDALKIDGQWGNTAISTFDFGYFSTNILSIRVEVPANATGTYIRSSSWVEFGTGPIAREAIFTTAACDFSNTYALRTSLGSVARYPAGSIAFNFKYTLGNPTTTAVKIEPGKVYYINVRNRYGDGSNSCFMEACSMRGGLPR